MAIHFHSPRRLGLLAACLASAPLVLAMPIQAQAQTLQPLFSVLRQLIASPCKNTAQDRMELFILKKSPLRANNPSDVHDVRRPMIKERISERRRNHDKFLPGVSAMPNPAGFGQIKAIRI